MNESSYEGACNLIPRTYVSQGRDARRTHEKNIQNLIEKVSIIGLDIMIIMMWLVNW